MASDTDPVIALIDNFLEYFEGPAEQPLVEEYTAVIYGFDVNSSQLRPGHESALRSLATLGEVSDGRLEVLSVVGGASATGPESRNDVLAAERAAAVEQFLLGLGIVIPPASVYSEGERRLLEKGPNENALNRSVVVTYRLSYAEFIPVKPTAAGKRWNLDFSSGFSVGEFIGGQVMRGILTNRDTGERRGATMIVAGLELGGGLPFSATVSIANLTSGDFELDEPASFADFDGCAVGVVGGSAGAGTGGGAALVVFKLPNEVHAVVQVGLDIGVLISAGVEFMPGLLIIDAPSSGRPAFTPI